MCCVFKLEFRVCLVMIVFAMLSPKERGSIGHRDVVEKAQKSNGPSLDYY